jgi:hypothetical protein
MTSALLLSYFGLVVFDVWATIKLLTKLGVDAELNDAVKWAIKKLGLARGVTLGVMLPASAWGVVLAAHPVLLAILVGWRCNVTFNQLYTLRALRGASPLPSSTLSESSK